MYFCKEPDGGELAVLVDQANGQKVTVYAHDGQQREADVEYVKTCKPLNNPEESDLYKELVGQGYKEIEVMKKFKDDAATERPVDECINKMVESVIGGSPICEAVKKIASVIFEGMQMPDYENDIYTDEQEGGDFLDSSMATEEDRLQEQYGTHMTVGDDELLSGWDKPAKSMSTESNESKSPKEMLEELRQYNKANVVSDKDKEELITNITRIVKMYFESNTWKHMKLENLLNDNQCQYDDFLTVREFVTKHSEEDLFRKMLDILASRICTLPCSIHIRNNNVRSVRLYRKHDIVEKNVDNVDTIKLYLPALAIFSDRLYVIPTDIDFMLGTLENNGAKVRYPMYVEARPYNHLYWTQENIFVFKIVIPRLAKLLEPDEQEVEDDDIDYDDTMLPGNRTSDDAFTDYEEHSNNPAYQDLFYEG